MKTFEEFQKEVESERLMSVVPGVEIIRTARQVNNEAAKRYAAQVAKNALWRAKQARPRPTQKSILETEIITP